MRNKLLTLFAIFASLFSTGIVSAANIDHFIVEINPSNAKVWEALDINVKAVDENNNTVTDYAWSILIFSDSDVDAEFPWILEENTYTFETEDQWEIKFENSVKFSSEWVHDISVYDLENEEVFGIAEANIWSDWTNQAIDAQIMINSPDSGITIWKNTINVSGMTNKNHKVKVNLNDGIEFEWNSDENWAFEIEVSDIPDGENKIKALVMDADMNVIGVSEYTIINIESMAPRLNSIIIEPSEELDIESSFYIRVFANSGLEEVSTIINDQITILEEKESWSYEASIVSPSTPGEYKIDINLKDDLWHETKESAIKILKVKALEVASEPVVVEEEEEKEEEENFKITNIKLVKLKTKSILTWDKVEKAESYNIYIKDKDSSEMKLFENVSESKIEINITWDQITYDEFAIKAIAKEWEEVLESANYSEMTNVQTGPAEMVLLALLSLIIWSFIAFRKKV